MDDNNKDVAEPLKPTDVKAARNKHRELHALLVFISQDEFKSFGKLSGEDQQSLLNLARSTSDTLGECLGHS